MSFLLSVARHVHLTRCALAANEPLDYALRTGNIRPIQACCNFLINIDPDCPLEYSVWSIGILNSILPETQSIERLILLDLQPDRRVILSFLSAQDSVPLPELDVYGTYQNINHYGLHMADSSY